MGESLYQLVEGVAWITLNRPDAGNALDLSLAERLGDAVRQAEADQDARCVVLRGAGRHFSVGGDVKFFAGTLDLPEEKRRRVYEDILSHTIPAFRRLSTMPKPVLASVHGAVAGVGVSLVGASDLAIAADDAVFAMAFSRIGGTPDSGATYVLSRTASAKKAAELVYLGERFGAADAQDLGLVNWVCPAADLAARTAALARRLADGPTRAYGRSKRLLKAAPVTGLDEQLQAEAESFIAGSVLPEFAEGLRSFLEKRDPDFRSAVA